MEVREGVSVVPQVEGEASVMESESTDNITAKTESEMAYYLEKHFRQQAERGDRCSHPKRECYLF